MFTRKLLNVTFYVHWISCFRSTKLLDFTPRPIHSQLISIPSSDLDLRSPHSALHANSTRCSQAVTHLSADHAQCCLTAPSYGQHMQSACHDRWLTRDHLDINMWSALFLLRFQTKIPTNFSSFSCELHVQTNWSFSISSPSWYLSNTNQVTLRSSIFFSLTSQHLS